MGEVEHLHRGDLGKDRGEDVGDAVGGEPEAIEVVEPRKGGVLEGGDEVLTEVEGVEEGEVGEGEGDGSEPVVVEREVLSSL